MAENQLSRKLVALAMVCMDRGLQRPQPVVRPSTKCSLRPPHSPRGQLGITPRALTPEAAGALGPSPPSHGTLTKTGELSWHLDVSWGEEMVLTGNNSHFSLPKDLF